MTPLEEQVQKNTTSIKTISDSLIEYVKDTDLDKSNDNISVNTADIEQLRSKLVDLWTQINLQNRIEQMKDTNIVDAAKLDLLQYDVKDGRILLLIKQLLDYLVNQLIYKM